MTIYDLDNSRGSGYVVVLTRRADGHQWLAYGKYGLPSIFERRRQAVAYRDELVEHGLPKGKVVKVTWAVGEFVP